MFTALLLLATPMPSPPSALSKADAAVRAAHPEALAFFADRDAIADVDNALARAKAEGKTVLIVMGANWCHDSVALAGWLDTPRFLMMMTDRFVIVYVDVGTPQTGKGRNLEIAQRFGIAKVTNTPLVLLVSADGKRLNSPKDATAWRNAASRSEEEIYRYFSEFTSA
jgi:thiol-disulfide isomerase/thioredoxin